MVRTVRADLLADPGALPPPERTADEARAAAEAILARPEFQPPPRSLLDVISEAIGEVFDRIAVPALGGGRGNAIAWVLVVLGIAVTAVFVYRFVTSATPSAARRERQLGDPKRPAGDWRDEAERAEGAGRWKDALRYRYRELVAELAERGLLEEVPGRTAGEYRQQLAARAPDRQAPFATATDLFERAWYGDEPTGEAELRRFRANAGDVLAAVPA